MSKPQRPAIPTGRRFEAARVHFEVQCPECFLFQYMPHGKWECISCGTEIFLSPLHLVKTPETSAE